MSKAHAHVAELAEPLLHDGEQLLATARLNYNGTLPGNTLALDASISAVDASGPVSVPDPGAVVAFPTANQVAVALTGERLIVWGLGMSGKPKQRLGDVPLVGIAKAQLRGGHAPQLRVTMKSGAIVDLEFMRGEPADEFVGALAPLLD